MSRGFTEGDPRAVAAGQKGGLERGKQLGITQRRKWMERFPEVTPEAARAIYQSGYVAGWAAKRNARRQRG